MSPKPRRLPRRDERGLALPSAVTLIAAAAVAVLAIVFVTTLGGGSGDADSATPPKPSVTSKITGSPDPKPSSSTTPSAKPKPSKTAQPKPTTTALPTVQRSRYPLSIFNTTSISGLAASVASKAESKGWTIHGTGNWNGNVPTTTVYYPSGMADAAQVLAHDLGIGRVVSAKAGGISIVRLSVILTGPLG